MNETLLTNDVITQPAFDPDKNYLEELVGEGKKFKTPEALAKGKAEADLMITLANRKYDDLASNYARLQEEYNAGPKLKELLDQIKTQTQQQSDHDNTLNVNATEKPVIDSTQIESLISSTLEKRETARKESENFNFVRSKLEEKYGENYNTILNSQRSDLGLSAEELDTLARRNPKLFMRSFGLEAPANKQESFNAPPRSDTRSDNFAPSAQKRTYAYYKKLKNPDGYFDPKTTTQMFNDIKEMGEEAFYDID